MIIDKTERLTIRHLTKDDYLFILKLLNQPSFIENIADKNVKNKQDAINHLRENPIASYQKFGFGLYMVELTESNTPVGMCGLIKRDEFEDVDIGYAFLSEFTGKGFAYEAAKAVLKDAVNAHQLKRIIALTKLDNNASIKLLEKLNFKFEKIIDFNGNKDKLFGLNISSKL
jgi:ribosomal-protein-alanine N-acetyltransferase